MRSMGKTHDPPNCVGYCLECEYMSHDSEGQEVAMFGILDWEACLQRFQTRPAVDVYINPRYELFALYYLTQGVYKMYYTHVQADSSQTQKCEQVFQAQGNNPDGEKEVRSERSLSMSDIVVLSDFTVWLCAKQGWIQLGVKV